MRLFCFALLIIVFPKTIFCQSIYGSYSIGAICKDGIVLGSDSRGSFFENGHPDSVYGYFDGIQKLFIIKNCAMSFTGPMTLDYRFIPFYVSEFEKTIKTNSITPIECYNGFQAFLKKNYEYAAEDFRESKVFIAGMDGDSMYLCQADLRIDKGACYIDSGVVESANATLFYSKYGRGFCKTRKSNFIAILIKKEIKNYADRSKRTKSIGGKISVLKIALDGKIQWLKNKPKNPRWKVVADFSDDYKQKKVRVHYTLPQYKTKIECEVLKMCP